MNETGGKSRALLPLLLFDRLIDRFGATAIFISTAFPKLL